MRIFEHSFDLRFLLVGQFEFFGHSFHLLFDRRAAAPATPGFLILSHGQVAASDQAAKRQSRDYTEFVNFHLSVGLFVSPPHPIGDPLIHYISKDEIAALWLQPIVGRRGQSCTFFESVLAKKVRTDPDATLWKQPSYAFGLLHPFDPKAQGGQTHGELLFSGQRQDLRVRCLQDAEQLLHYFGFAPEKTLQILHPFKIGNYHTTGIAQHIRDYEDFGTLAQDRISFDGCWAIS